MARIGDFVDTGVAPIGADAVGAEVFDRFQAEPNTLAIAVVDAEQRPIGLVERNAFTLKMAAEFGRALYAKRPVSALMETQPYIADVAAEADSFLQSLSVADMGVLLKGFIVVKDGRYHGVGAALNVLQAGSAVYRRQAETLARAEAEARASSRAKSEFLAVMSHEIRTPLNGVLGLAALLEREVKEEGLKQYARTIVDSGQLLLRLLNDALDMSRAQAGVLDFQTAPVHIDQIGSDLFALWKARADEKGIGFRIDCDTAGADWIMADETRLKQLLNNLIGNALKFTPAGEIAVSLTSEWQGGSVRLQGLVDDSGPGVPPEAAATIFNPFNTGKAGREGAGAGLGLAICRQIVEAMDGTIEVETSPAGGARFRFEVQAPCADPAARLAAQAMVEPTPHETLHVLVVDDNATNRLVAGKLLETFGCSSDFAEDGAQAVEAVAVGRYDLVLMDIKMPVMDGVAATRAIRQIPGLSRLPILALTANSDDRDADVYRAAGMDGVCSKPIQPDALLNAIRLALTPPPPQQAILAA